MGYKHTEEAKAKIAAAVRARYGNLTVEQKRETNRRRCQAWNEKNRERSKAIKRASYERHRLRINAAHREKNKSAERKAFMREYLPQHRAANPDLYRTYTHNRLARRKAGGTHTVAQWRAKLAEYGGRCAYCGGDQDITRDHDIPLSRGGSNEISNIVPACARCNYSKKALTGQEFRDHRLKEFA